MIALLPFFQNSALAFIFDLRCGCTQPTSRVLGAKHASNPESISVNPVLFNRHDWFVFVRYGGADAVAGVDGACQPLGLRKEERTEAPIHPGRHEKCNVEHEN